MRLDYESKGMFPSHCSDAANCLFRVALYIHMDIEAFTSFVGN